jgi:hypothetical protein
MASTRREGRQLLRGEAEAAAYHEESPWGGMHVMDVEQVVGDAGEEVQLLPLTRRQHQVAQLERLACTPIHHHHHHSIISTSEIEDKTCLWPNRLRSLTRRIRRVEGLNIRINIYIYRPRYAAGSRRLVPSFSAAARCSRSHARVCSTLPWASGGHVASARRHAPTVKPMASSWSIAGPVEEEEQEEEE